MRYHDWRSRLSARVNELRSTPFQWGQFDCVGYAAALVEAMTGEDFFADFRGKYDSALGAARALQESGATDLESYVAQRFVECPPAFASIGDIAFIPTEHGNAAGIVVGERVAAMNAEGPGTVDRSMVVRAFRVG